MIKKIISYLLTFVLIVLLVVSVAITIVSKTILSEKYILGVLDKNNYYTEMYHEILESFKDNTIQSGLDETILDGVMTEEQVKKDIQSLIHYLYTGTKMSIDTEGVKTRLQEKINQVIQENNKKVNSSEQQEIDIYVNTIANIYSDGIAYAEKYIPTIQSVLSKIQNTLTRVQMIPYVAIIVVAILLLAINKKESLKYFSIASISTGILFIILKIIESSTMRIQNILILNKAFSNVLINAIQNIMFIFLFVGIIFSIIGIILSLIANKKSENVAKH